MLTSRWHSWRSVRSVHGSSCRRSVRPVWSCPLPSPPLPPPPSSFFAVRCGQAEETDLVFSPSAVAAVPTTTVLKKNTTLPFNSNAMLQL
mmetsp:Transcript_48713/g.117856  ORF Transcript_48713/g.117856 Transcript_48713/m.117856 type:complete len:90 (-) Transcript_48713:108-377(-)